MPTIAIVGAGPGLGRSLAKTFGRRGFSTALISRSPDKLDALSEHLAHAGITAAGFPADVADPDSLTTALRHVADQLGPIDVLEYSPYAGLTPTQPADVTIDNLRPEIETLLYGAITATHAVLPAMLAAGAGTLLYTTGGGAIHPYPMLANVNIAQAGLRNWVFNLHNTLGDKGIHAATVAISVFIGATAPEGVPHLAPDVIAQTYWDLHEHRDRPDHHITG